MARTRKPCPGCGVTYDFPFRDADKVCTCCAKKLHEYDAKVAALPPGIIDAIVPQAGHELPYLDDQTRMSCRRPAQDKMRSAFVDLLMAATTDSPAPSDFRTPAVFKHAHEYTGTKGKARRIDKRFAIAAATFWHTVGPAMAESAAIGCDRGSSLLSQLARGELTCDEFNKAQIKSKG